MAMDALKNLSNNVPGWLKQLDEVSGQIDQRQAELAAVAAAEGKSPETKSLRNKGSTESLRPKDDVPMTSAPDDTIPEEAPVLATESSTPEPSPPSPDALKQSQEAIEAARARVRQAKRRQRSSQPMIISYYGSYVQDFFDNLVRFISSSRNLIRKAKMAAKVAQIKRLAEVDMSEGNEDGDYDPLLSLRYMSTRRGYGPARANNQPPDVYDRLDKSLEIVQSMCEHGAHQFLRDGDCNDEISKVQKQLTEVLEVATEEIERIQREEPEFGKETGGLGKIRIRRPVSVRREMSPGLKDSSPLTPIECDSIELEADHNVDSFHSLQTKGRKLRPTVRLLRLIKIDISIKIPELQDQLTWAMRNRGLASRESNRPLSHPSPLCSIFVHNCRRHGVEREIRLYFVSIVIKDACRSAFCYSASRFSNKIGHSTQVLDQALDQNQ